MAIVVAFVAGTLVSGGIALADGDAITKLTKECSKDPKSDDKIKAHCELLNLVVGLQGQIDILEVPPAEVIVNIDGINVPPTPITINAPQGEKGEQGDPGTNGINGAKGNKGDKGDTGSSPTADTFVEISASGTIQAGQAGLRTTLSCTTANPYFEYVTEINTSANVVREDEVHSNKRINPAISFDQVVFNSRNFDLGFSYDFTYGIICSSQP